jgi:hypothetical protein
MHHTDLPETIYDITDPTTHTFDHDWVKARAAYLDDIVVVLPQDIDEEVAVARSLIEQAHRRGIQVSFADLGVSVAPEISSARASRVFALPPSVLPSVAQGDVLE